MKRRVVLLGDDKMRVYGERERNRMGELFDVLAFSTTKSELLEDKSLSCNTEAIFSTWGMPQFTIDEISKLQKLEGVFYAAGTVKSFATPFLDAGKFIVSARVANAIPVAEFTFAQIIMGLKQVYQNQYEVKTNKRFRRKEAFPVTGGYGSTVSLVALGQIAQKVALLLKSLDVNVIAYDIFTTPAEAAELGVELVSLDECFAKGDVVSLHLPNLPSTQKMINASHFNMMKPGSLFINTARGAVIDEAEMIETLEARPEIWAVLDVTHPEPPSPNSKLYELENIILTPHIAGSLGNETHRMADFVLSDAERWLAGEAFLYSLTKEALCNMA